MTTIIPDLHISKSPNARVTRRNESYWHLEISASPIRGYRLAQLDDHGRLRRHDFHWKPPATLSLRARVSAQDLPGTWGFGLWNDPFSFLLGSQGVIPRFPALPDAVWFFHASPQSYLSFRDDLPAQGFLAATFKSTRVPALWLALASPALALSLIPGIAQSIRGVLRRLIQQDAALINTDVTAWHTYEFEWDIDQVRFRLDGIELMRTHIAPAGPLSLVLWIDNQYAALPPHGGLRYGTLPGGEPAWLEIDEFSMHNKS